MQNHVSSILCGMKFAPMAEELRISCPLWPGKAVLMMISLQRSFNRGHRLPGPQEGFFQHLPTFSLKLQALGTAWSKQTTKEWKEWNVFPHLSTVFRAKPRLCNSISSGRFGFTRTFPSSIAITVACTFGRQSLGTWHLEPEQQMQMYNDVYWYNLMQMIQWDRYWYSRYTGDIQVICYMIRLMMHLLIHFLIPFVRLATLPRPPRSFQSWIPRHGKIRFELIRLDDGKYNQHQTMVLPDIAKQLARPKRRLDMAGLFSSFAIFPAVE